MYKQDTARPPLAGQPGPVVRLTALLALLVLGSFSLLSAQTIVTPLWPDRGITPRDQLWSISLLNTQPEAYTGRVEMTVSDAGNGTPVFSGTSNLFTVAAGGNALTAQRVLPVTYTLLSATYNFNPSVNTLLPPGIFNVCYRVYRLGGEIVTLQGEGCFVLESDPLTPPSLVIPGDNDTLNTGRPFFTWLPPVPSTTLSFLNYTFRLVEKGNDQSAQEAAERNLPLFTQARIVQNSINYPAALPALDTGKLYAWQVLAYNDLSYVAASECWTFTIGTDSAVAAPVSSRPYVPLIRAGSAQLVTTAGQFRFIYNNESADTTAVCHINTQLSAEDSSAGTIDHVVPVVPGVNYITIGLAGVTGLQKNLVYELHIMNSRRERWWADFIWVD